MSAIPRWSSVSRPARFAARSSAEKPNWYISRLVSASGVIGSKVCAGAGRDDARFFVAIGDQPRRRALDLADVAAIGRVDDYAALAAAGAVVGHQRRRTQDDFFGNL